FRFGITYDTPAAAVREAAALAARIVRAQPGTRFDRAHFFALDEQRLTFEVAYIALTADYHRHMDIPQDVNLKLLDGIPQPGIRVALPVRRVELGADSRDFLARHWRGGETAGTGDSTHH